MYAQLDKSKESKGRGVANSVSQKKSGGKQAVGFMDNRAEAVAQKKTDGFRALTPAIQRIEETGGSQSGGNSGSALLATIEELEAVTQSDGTDVQKSKEDGLIKEMKIRVAELKKIALNGTETEKTLILESLKEELGKNSIKSDRQSVVQKKGLGKILAGGIGLGVVVGIGYLAKKIYEYRRDRREDEMIGDLLWEPAVVPAEITDGVGGLPPADQLNMLFQRINNYRFRYGGQSHPASVGFGAHTGDCLTLVRMYIEAANVIGIAGVVANQNVNRQLVAARAIHGRNTQGNTDGNDGWYFENHYWVTVGGIVYDLLFMNVGAVAAINSNGHAVHNNVTYYTFPDGRCVIEHGAANLNYQVQGQGKVFADAAAAQVFINNH